MTGAYLQSIRPKPGNSLLGLCSLVSNYKVIILCFNNMDNRSLVFIRKRERQSLVMEIRTEFEKVHTKTQSTLYCQLALVNFAKSLWRNIASAVHLVQNRKPRGRARSFTCSRNLEAWHRMGAPCELSQLSVNLLPGDQAYRVGQYVSHRKW